MMPNPQSDVAIRLRSAGYFYVRLHITKGESDASVTSKLRVLQQRPPARIW